jgi:hypothetical protein
MASESRSETTAKGADESITDLEQLLDRIDIASREGSKITLEAVIEALGRRSFGPLLLLAGLITLSPIGDIPGTPTLMAFLVLLVAGQLIGRRRSFWFPGWLLRRSISERKMATALKWLRPPARFIDRFLKPRMAYFTGNLGLYGIAFICIVIALAMPPMEFVPFSATGAGLALTAFDLALIAHDGLLALGAFVITVATLGAVLVGLL